eukprot:4436477-Amphidinium_carterae.1
MFTLLEPGKEPGLEPMRRKTVQRPPAPLAWDRLGRQRQRTRTDYIELILLGWVLVSAPFGCWEEWRGPSMRCESLRHTNLHALLEEPPLVGPACGRNGVD